MPISLFGNTIRSIPGTTNNITIDTEQYELYQDFMTNILGNNTILAVSIGIRRSKSLRLGLGLYYLTDLLEFRMEGIISILSASTPKADINTDLQVTAPKDGNSKRIIHITGKASKLNNNTQWAVEDLTDNNEPPIRLDPRITSETFKENSSIQAGSLNVFYAFNDKSFKLGGSVIGNDDTANIAFFAVSSMESSYNIRVGDSIVSGSWK